MFDFLAGLLAFFYDVWPSYGGAIILFTVAIYLVLTPLSIKSTRSMIAMQRVGPEMKKLQQKYKDDRETLNREMMAFYQANNINPFSSCLPLLLQMPVFIVLYQVLQGLTRRGDDGNFNPKYLEGEDAALAVALRATDKMMSFGMDLSQSALSELQDRGIFVAIPFIILVGLVAGTAWVQQRQISGRSRNGAASPQQQAITKLMPFIFIPISVSLPAGVVLYFVVSNVVRIGQQALVTRIEYGDDGEPVKPPATKGDGAKGGSSGAKGGSSGAKGGSNGSKGGSSGANGKGTTPSAGGEARPRNRKRKKKRK